MTGQPSEQERHDEHAVPDTDVRESNPGSAGPEGLQGDLGISSERTGPLGDNPADRGVEGTGSHGSATQGTDGVLDTEPGGTGGAGGVPREHPQEPAEGEDPDDDRPDQERTSTEDPAEGADPDDDQSSDPTGTGIDRTVGEVNPDPVANKHEFDPARNPGH